jgi:hypothetical protein
LGALCFAIEHTLRAVICCQTGNDPEFHPPMMTKTSMVSDASTSTVSKEASFMTPSASYPGATVSDSIN